MTLYRRLALSSTVATLVLVAIGGLVRATKSGLGCGTNWPDCPGEVNRALIIEFSHRTVAGIVIVLIAALVVVAFRLRSEHPRLLAPSAVALGLVLSQAVLGAIVVWLELEAESVVLHLALAMALVAWLIHITALAFAIEGRLPPGDRALSRQAMVAAGGVLLLLLVGSYVTGRGAGYVFPDWPLMDGRVVPDLGVELEALHFFHRALAGVVGVVLGVFCWKVVKRRNEYPVQARLAYLAAGLFLIEVGIGAINVWTQLNSAAVTLHLAIGALIWASTVGMVVLFRTSEARVPVDAGRRRAPVLESAR